MLSPFHTCITQKHSSRKATKQHGKRSHLPHSTWASYTVKTHGLLANFFQHSHTVKRHFDTMGSFYFSQFAQLCFNLSHVLTHLWCSAGQFNSVKRYLGATLSKA